VPRLYTAYLAAAVAGIAAPLLLLHIARSAPAGFDPMVTATAIVCALGVVSGLLAVMASGHWIYLALVASGPTALLGLAMYFALAEAGGRYGVWLVVGVGSLVFSLVTAALAGRVATRFKASRKT
jgi:hypothetical protein